MVSLLQSKLVVVTGKGGAGKSTIACALGLLGARSGLRTVVAELGEHRHLATLLGHPEPPESGQELQLGERLWSLSIDPDVALSEGLRALSGRVSARLIAQSSTFGYLSAAAPGMKELVAMIKLRELCEGGRTRKDKQSYDLVVLDAPATGHALAMLRSPQTFASIVRAGPLADQAKRVRELLEDPSRSSYVAVAQGTETTITETLELAQSLHSDLGRELDAILLNGLVPRRFAREEELADIARLEGSREPLVRTAARVAKTTHERARLQQNQLARLRRSSSAWESPPQIVTVPFMFASQLDLGAVNEIGTRLERSLT
jgi:anion-transporting  ArsA/GET3 family ATPase